MARITHECGYDKEIGFMCPKCGKPICNEDTQQSIGGMLFGHLINFDKIRKVEVQFQSLCKKVEILQGKVKEIQDRMDRCRRCPGPAGESDPYYMSELLAINGIGDKIAQDIVAVYPTMENLQMAIQDGEKLPFDDNIEKLLREKWS